MVLPVLPRPRAEMYWLVQNPTMACMLSMVPAEFGVISVPLLLYALKRVRNQDTSTFAASSASVCVMV